MDTLTQPQLKELLHYDPETGIFTWAVDRRGGAKKGDIAGFRIKNRNGNHARGLAISPGMSTEIYAAHRIAYLYMTGEFPASGVKHINGINSDNRWTNLRLLSTNKTSGYTGVTWSKSNSKWVAQIGVKGKAKHLGLFTDLEEAVRVRKEAELEHGYHENHGSNRPL
jgi:hypothetical protein